MLITAIELGLRERIEIVPVQVLPIQPSDAVNQVNPIGKIPVLIDGLLDAAVDLDYETWLRPPELQWNEWIAGQTGKIERGLDALEGNVASLSGVTIGTITAACALGYLDQRFSRMPWRDRGPQLSSWLADFAQRPSFQSTDAPT